MEKKTREIEINGCCEIPDEMTEDEFYNIFIEFIESHGWYFGGGINEYREEQDKQGNL